MLSVHLALLLDPPAIVPLGNIFNSVCVVTQNPDAGGCRLQFSRAVAGILRDFQSLHLWVLEGGEDASHL